MTVLRKSVELRMPLREAEECWAQFEKTRAELVGNAQVGFEEIDVDSTRVTLSGESPSIEGTADEFRKFVQTTAIPARPSAPAPP